MPTRRVDDSEVTDLLEDRSVNETHETRSNQHIREVINSFNLTQVPTTSTLSSDINMLFDGWQKKKRNKEAAAGSEVGDDEVSSTESEQDY